MFKVSSLLVILVLISGCGSNTSSIDYFYTVTSDVVLFEEFSTIEQGIKSNVLLYPDRQVLFFDNAIAFDTFYQAFQNSAYPTPSVDFGIYRVLVLIDKKHSSDGYSAEIISVVKDTGLDYTVKSNFYSPRASFEKTLGQTKPYHIVKVPIV